MKRLLPILIMAVAAALPTLLGGCSDPAGGDLGPSPHPEGFANPQSPHFHGDEFITAGFRIPTCAGCHLRTENSQEIWDCWTCHAEYPHTEAINDLQNGHGGFVRSIQYQVWECADCHGADYAGGVADSLGQAERTCVECHEATPEACNTCHGRFQADPADTAAWAPPPDLLGLTDLSLASVGAHTHHVNPEILNTPHIGGPYSCAECHVLPDSVMEPGHVNDGSAVSEIVWGPIATDSNADPSWNRDESTCSGVYCHGNFDLGHPDNTPSWVNPDGSQLPCGVCHGMPPEENHPDDDDCVECHGTVVNAGFDIINPALHVNGRVNFN
jgi:predicted CxxxxCH...CXXCH cytochrome family protein